MISFPLFLSWFSLFFLPCFLLSCIVLAKTTPPSSLLFKPISPLLLDDLPPRLPKVSACQSETVISVQLCFYHLFWWTKLNISFLFLIRSFNSILYYLIRGYGLNFLHCPVSVFPKTLIINFMQRYTQNIVPFSVLIC